VNTKKQNILIFVIVAIFFMVACNKYVYARDVKQDTMVCDTIISEMSASHVQHILSQLSACLRPYHGHNDDQEYIKYRYLQACLDHCVLHNKSYLKRYKQIVLCGSGAFIVSMLLVTLVDYYLQKKCSSTVHHARDSQLSCKQRLDDVILLLKKSKSLRCLHAHGQHRKHEHVIRDDCLLPTKFSWQGGYVLGGVFVVSMGLFYLLFNFLTRRKQVLPFYDTLTRFVAHWPEHKIFTPVEFYVQFDKLFDDYYQNNHRLPLTEVAARSIMRKIDMKILNYVL